MARYRLYIDESGDHVYPKEPDPPSARYLSLTGLCIEQSYYRREFYPSLEQLKARHFSWHPDDDPLVLVRRRIMDRKGPFGVLNDDARNDAWENDLINFILTAEYWALTIVLDKYAHYQRYVTPSKPYHYCMEIMLERFQGFLQRGNHTGDVMAESRNGIMDDQLKGVYRRAWNRGTRYVNAVDYQRRLTSKELKIRRKGANVAGLQLADLVAAPSKWLVLDKNDCLKEGLGLCTQAVMIAVETKHPSYGLKMIG